MKVTNILGIFLILSLNSGCSTTAEKSESKSSESQGLFSSVLNEYRGKILELNDIQKLAPLEQKSGWGFSVQSPQVTGLKHGVFKLRKIVGDEYFFDYVDILPDGIKVRAKYKWKDGYKYFLRKNVEPMVYELSPSEKCKFVVGDCQYKTHSGSVEYMHTEYRNGIWIRKIMALGIVKKSYIDIYDKSGFPIYHKYENAITGQGFERIRVEGKLE